MSTPLIQQMTMGMIFVTLSTGVTIHLSKLCVPPILMVVVWQKQTIRGIQRGPIPLERRQKTSMVLRATGRH